MYEDLISSLRLCRQILHEDDKCIEFVDGCCEAFPVCAYQLMEKAADAIEELTDRNVGKWIPVTERLPENEVPVLVVRRFLGVKDCPPKTYVEMAEYCYGDWVADSDEYKIARNRHTDPLYWMPLPEPPESEDE